MNNVNNINNINNNQPNKSIVSSNNNFKVIENLKEMIFKKMKNNTKKSELFMSIRNKSNARDTDQNSRNTVTAKSIVFGNQTKKNISINPSKLFTNSKLETSKERINPTNSKINIKGNRNDNPFDSTNSKFTKLKDVIKSIFHSAKTIKIQQSRDKRCSNSKLKKNEKIEKSEQNPNKNDKKYKNPRIDYSTNNLKLKDNDSYQENNNGNHRKSRDIFNKKIKNLFLNKIDCPDKIISPSWKSNTGIIKLGMSNVSLDMFNQKSQIAIRNHSKEGTKRKNIY